MEGERLTTTIAAIMLVLLFLVSCLLLFFNQFVSKKIWQPFYQTIRQIENFSFENSKATETVSTDIKEFRTLDVAIQQMTNKVTQDYHSLKQFTENASHEIQTPLAVIKSQIELLIQKADWEEHEWKALNNINEAASRLSKLNQALLLLTRIENQQYGDTKTINLKECVLRKLDQLEPMTEDKNLTIQTDLQDKLLHINPNLADILLNNLLGNAVKHNLSNGTLEVFLNDTSLLIRNTGQVLTTPPDDLFKRFQKNNKSSASLGLGLAIVQQICERYDFRIYYSSEDQWHKVEVLF
jgi:signal transduction histidine kinase